MYVKKAPDADACPWRPGLRCTDNPPDCAHCGWFPAEEKRRKLDRLARGGRKMKAGG